MEAANPAPGSRLSSSLQRQLYFNVTLNGQYKQGDVKNARLLKVKVIQIIRTKDFEREAIPLEKIQLALDASVDGLVIVATIAAWSKCICFNTSFMIESHLNPTMFSMLHFLAKLLFSLVPLLISFFTKLRNALLAPGKLLYRIRLHER